MKTISLVDELKIKAKEVAVAENMLNDLYFYDFRENIYHKNMADRIERMFLNGSGQK